MDNNKLVQLASKASIGVALILTLLKLYAAYVTQSLSIISSLFDSSVDMLASIGNLIAITFAAKPADHKFQFGYGKLEAVSALIQSMLIIGSLLFLIGEAIQRFAIADAAVQHPEIGLWVMILSIALTLVLTTFQRHVITKTNSIAIKADSLHYKTDIAVNIVVILSLYLSRYYSSFDTFACVGISAYIMWATKPMIIESLSVLLDKHIDGDVNTNIVAILNNHPHVKGFHNFRTRSSGNRIFIEAHVEMDPKLTLVEAHTIAHELKDAVEKIYPHAEMIVHQDPFGYDHGSERRF